MNFKLSNQMLNHVSNISASNAIISTLPLPKSLEAKLHQDAIVKSTHYSTKIEGNQITLEKVQTFLKGEEIVARTKDIQEIKNYKNALDFIAKDGVKIDKETMLKLHKILTKDIYEGKLSGYFREAQNAIYDAGGELVYVPPKVEDVELLIEKLLQWLEDNRYLHSLIKTAIFHYQFVTIHPFMDGNGRTARLLCELMLKNYGYDSKKLLSLDSYYEENLSEYYDFLDQGVDYYEDRVGADVSEWIVFYLRSMDIVYDTIKEETVKLYKNEGASKGVNEGVNQLHVAIQKHPNKRVPFYASKLKTSEKNIERWIKQLKEEGKIEFQGSPKTGGYIAK